MSACPWCRRDAAADLRAAVLAVAPVLVDQVAQRLAEIVRPNLDRAIAEHIRPRPISDPSGQVLSLSAAMRAARCGYRPLARALRLGIVRADLRRGCRTHGRWRICRASLEAWIADRGWPVPRANVGDREDLFQ